MSSSIDVQLGEILSRKDCADIVKHIIKFVVYNNQQIPYTYDGFQRIIARKKYLDGKVKGDMNCSKPLSFKQIQANRFFDTIETIYKTFEAIFECIEKELMSGNNLKEIVVILGTTVISPKHVYRIRIPKLSSQDTSGRKMRSHLFRIYRSIISSRGEKNFSCCNHGLTNIYLLINGECQHCVNSGLFVLKHNFRIPPSAAQTFISFDSPSDDSEDLAHPDEKCLVNEDLSTQTVISTCSSIDICSNSLEGSDKWFLASQVLRGFNDLKIDGVSFYNILHEGC